MKIKDNKCKCGHDDFFFADKGSQKGIYCSYCGKWLKWADKDEQNLAMKQKSINDVLDKIRDEISEIDDEIVLNPDSFYERKMYVRFSEVINIIDKHKKESEAAEI